MSDPSAPPGGRVPVPERPGTDQILLGDNLALLPAFTDESFQLVYIDPPFNTGKVQARRTLQAARAVDGERTGFQGRRYTTRLLAQSSYRDRFDDYLAFLAPRLEHAHRLLAPRGHAVLPHRLPRGAPLQAAAG